MKRKMISLIAALGCVVSLLAGCGKTGTDSNAVSSPNVESNQESTSAVNSSEEVSSETSDAAKDKIVIRSCFATGMTGAVNKFAIEKGLYEELGIEFDNLEWSSNDEVLSLMTRGEIDVADGDPSSYVPGIYNGVPAKLVGNMWRYSGSYWLIANNDIKTIADLKGKTVGTAMAAGGMKLSVLEMLNSVGLTEDDVTLVANGAYQSAYATFTTGEVDATIIHNPYAALAESEGTGHILGRAWDYIPNYYTGTIIASNDMIEKRQADLQRFITAYYTVHEQVKNEYFDEFVTWVSTQMNTDEKVMRKAIESEKDVWLDYPVIPEKRLEYTVGLMKEYGWLDQNVDYSDTYTNVFAQAAADALGMTDPEAK